MKHAWRVDQNAISQYQFEGMMKMSQALMKMTFFERLKYCYRIMLKK